MLKVWGEIQSSNFQDIALTRPTSAFFSMLDTAVSLNFDLLTPKLEAVILVPKCGSVQDIVLITFGTHGLTDPQTDSQTDKQTDRLTVRIHNACGHYVGGDIIRRNIKVASALIVGGDHNYSVQ